MKTTGAGAVIQCLLEENVDTVFGYPGGMILPLYDALYDTPAIRQVVNFHEQGAAHAADGYARASGKVGVCIATSGPGATNLVTGLATAFMDSVPIVAITGQVDTTLLGRDAFQEVDIMGVTMPVTKHNFQVKDVNKLYDTLKLAFRVACTGRQGPVLVDVPKDVFLQSVEIDKQEQILNLANWQPSADLKISIAEAIEVIRKAKRPVIVAGGGVISAGAHQELLDFAENYHMPVVSTLMGLGGFPRSHEQSLGLSGMHGLEAANKAVFAADLVVAVGSRFGDRLTGNIDKYSQDKRVIHIDIDPSEIDKNVISSIGLAGDMKQILLMLTQPTNGHDINSWWQKIKTWQRQYQTLYDDSYLNIPWAMHYISDLIKRKDYVIVTDVGQHQMWAAQNLKIESSRAWITSGGLGTMGFGLPAAMGAQIALGEKKRVIHIAGDGGIKMTGNEYYTIAALGLPIISIIVNNAGLGMIRQLQKVFYKERYIACNFAHQPDYALYAQSFGINSFNVKTPDEFKDAFRYALASSTPQVIVVNVSSEFVYPMAKAGAGLNEFVEDLKDNIERIVK